VYATTSDQISVVGTAGGGIQAAVETQAVAVVGTQSVSVVGAQSLAVVVVVGW
jgi:hypothetical protein